MHGVTQKACQCCIQPAACYAWRLPSLEWLLCTLQQVNDSRRSSTDHVQHGKSKSLGDGLLYNGTRHVILRCNRLVFSSANTGKFGMLFAEQQIFQSHQERVCQELLTQNPSSRLLHGSPSPCSQAHPTSPSPPPHNLCEGVQMAGPGIQLHHLLPCMDIR